LASSLSQDPGPTLPVVVIVRSCSGETFRSFYAAL
jgi:hypothetical protein